MAGMMLGTIRFFIAIVCCYAVFTVRAPSVLAQDSAEVIEREYQEIIEKCLQACELVKSGTVVFNIRVPVATGYEHSYRDVKRSYSIAFDGSSQRSVVDWSGKSQWRESHLKNDSGVVHDPGEWSPHGWFIPNGDKQQARRKVVDPRLFGVSTAQPSSAGVVGPKFPDGCMWFTKKGKILGVTEHTQDSNVKSTVITFAPTEKTRVVGTFSSEHPLPIALRVEVNGTLVSETKCDFERFPHKQDGEIWFPRRVDYRRFSDDKLALHEVVEIVDARFGYAHEAGAFEIASLQLTDGRRFQSNGTELLYDGEVGVLRPATSSDVIDNETGNYANTRIRKSSGSTVWWWWLACIFVLVSVVLGSLVVLRVQSGLRRR